ncbi:hypothetical protein N7508_005365 [Penicillium antarcticum]|uniref:uncharacterized protein n=1 Tax=Penicillium antarcticum TaxID=416450 RepID=UPI00238B2E7D|nr:uncharacterized protein N7508_005365 [Penicillium antarcticum]KAJ5306350.1 hypothetical protein N7508_005365 [Penicillium antarcticum]
MPEGPPPSPSLRDGCPGSAIPDEDEYFQPTPLIVFSVARDTQRLMLRRSHYLRLGPRRVNRVMRPRGNVHANVNTDLDTGLEH